ncbi:cytidine and dCMP deaminase domain-containing protein 1 [Osmerus mordax]|uniref:cytidine and dCMP deaminase domain-containing protein 1 n=1 Tax=Osmerus mordax TaxID=8014 RepID=UPI0035105CB7
MARANNANINEALQQHCAVLCHCNGGRDVKEAGTQTDSKVQGHGPRLSKGNLFTLLSLWMELFPREELEHRNDDNESVRGTGLVVVREHRVVGLHCSGAELHAGQLAVIQHGPRLASCELYFSRRPCATCLKMIINAGVSRISFWPGDPEMSLLAGACDRTDSVSQEAVLDVVAVEKMKANSRPHIGVILQPLAPGLQQFVNETSKKCDFMERVSNDTPDLDVEDLFRRQWRQNLGRFSRFILPEQQHRDILTKMGLENFCMEPYFSSLRQNMRELVEVLASVSASVPPLQHGFYKMDNDRKEPQCGDLPQALPVSQEIARHCIIQAMLLAYRTEDHKVGVGAVIWAEAKSGRCDGTGRLYLVGCGYNAYPVGSEYAEYPQMDNKQQDRQRRKYRYIVHAEQNALTFRSSEVKDEENTMLFVTKCPCDECVPLILGAGIKQIYTTDLDSGKDKGDISYLRFSSLPGVQKFIWQKTSQDTCASAHDAHHLANGCMGKHDRQAEQESRTSKRHRPDHFSNLPPV